MKNLLNLNLKDIITEITRTRKGIFMLFFIFFLLCLLFDIYYLRPHDYILVWFENIYAAGLCLSCCALLAKIYNSICDKIDKKRAKEKNLEEIDKLIKVFLNFCEPVFTNLTGIEQLILADIARNHTNYTVIKSQLFTNEEMLIIAKNLVHKVKQLNMTMNISETYPNILIEVDELTKTILKSYYNIK